MRPWKAGVDKKLIARWQGHQDGGELILSTYTEVFGGDDAEYERGQLAKLTGTMAVARPSGSPVEEATSSPMKGPKKRDALPAPDSDSAVPPVPSLVNPYKKGDRVKTKCKGEEVEAEVTAVFNDELQVKTSDGERRWRTVRTAVPVTALVPRVEPAGLPKEAVIRKKKRTTGRLPRVSP